MIYKKVLSVLFSFVFLFPLIAQPERWQQGVSYEMEIDLDVTTHQFSGQQRLKYFNNSPDTLDKVFYHLYFNAFQPNSNMDVRSRTMIDPDMRVRDRISKLSPQEIGWHRINSLKIDGLATNYEVNETILEVKLPKPILPHSTAVLEMDFQSQIPLQIRRSGRNSQDGIDYTFTQWYPKMCEYDYQGWHANPYVAREFYGVWGDFDVKISIDKKYTLGASGVLENPNEIGKGYESDGLIVKQTPGGKLTWHWTAKNVHDFAWAADPDYRHLKQTRKDGLVLHFLYEDNEKIGKKWAEMPAIMDKVFDYINTHLGQYPYKSYAFIQGGDGGMEYPMATMLSGSASVGTFIHELIHAWYFGILGTNESLYAWMDEGFTEYLGEEVENYLRKEKIIAGEPIENPQLRANENYIRFLRSGMNEPLSTHADHFNINQAYSRAAYTGGQVFLTQMEYILGKKMLDKALLRYFDTWKFKHPNPNDFIRVMEKTSGLELDWFKEYFIYSTKTIDYAVQKVEKINRRESRIVLERKGKMPMPVDLLVSYRNGKKEMFHIPLDLMRGEKEQELMDLKYTVLPDWRWTHPAYEFTLSERYLNIEKVEIDNSKRLLDMNRLDNVWIQKEGAAAEED